MSAPKNKFELNLDDLSDVVIYPFFECNLRCVGCPVGKPKSREIGLLKSEPDDFVFHVQPEDLERIASWNVENIVILGGEPFLSSYLKDMLEVLTDVGKVIVYTNATLLHDSLDEAEEVLNLIDRVIVSLEGGREWTDRIRGRGVYDKARSVASKLKDRGYDVAVRMGYFEGNMFSVLSEIESLNEEDIPVLLFPRLDKPPMSESTVDYFYTAVSTFKKADILLPSYKNYVGGEGVTCPAGWAKVCVMPDGYLTPCQWNFEALAHIEWRDEEIEAVFTAWCERNFAIRDECWGCRYAYSCRSSCRASMDYLTCPVKHGLRLRESQL